jgi:hypothetical protein
MALLSALPASAAQPNPCAAPGVDFPAFAFTRPSGDSQQIYVTDATGKCTRFISLQRRAYVLQFSYPVDGTTNRGRLAYVELGVINGIDFTVNPTTKQVTVFPEKTLFTGTGGNISLSRNGLNLYTTRYPAEGGVVIERQALDITGSPVGAPTLHFSTTSDNGLFGISVNSAETLVFADFRPAPRASAPYQVAWIPLDGSNAHHEVASVPGRFDTSPAAHPSSDVVVYQNRVTEPNGCEQLVIKELGGATLTYPNGPKYGLKATWMGDKVLSDGRTKPHWYHGGCNYTGKIMRLDPTTGIQSVLISGYDPDGR